ncbi:hypothetical protein DDZ16_19660 [Marinilabilia rubra]|uniref:Uncharacterized protein n=2 Tax=Marinilabilia rubra TaxID=2162893 RepID=A0A2U2B3L1_9BACT|nr:hypothetical protein DDZ16_19660 [Marinilabilia rubra]
MARRILNNRITPTYLSSWLMLLFFGGFLAGCNSQFDEKTGCTDPRSLNYDPDAVYDSGECDYSDSYRYYMPEYWSETDEEGNLVVVNQTVSPLLLYSGSTHLRVIPPKAEEFLVDIPVKSETTHLSIYKAEDVDYVESPPQRSFKSWVVVLRATDYEEVPLGWVVSDLVTGEGSGSIMLSYPHSNLDENRLPCNVDVYLHSKTGGRITSVKPGTDQEVRIDYGTYRLWFHYWESDPTSPESIQTLGWKNTSDIVLNANYKSRDVLIPSFEAVPEDAAAIMVVNRYGETLSVKMGDRYIENLVVGRENTQGMSTIANRDTMIYPVTPGCYLLNFEELDGSQADARFYVDLNKLFVTRIVSGVARKEIVVNNQTEWSLFLGDDYYLGAEMDPQQQKSVHLPENLNLVNVFNSDSTFFKPVAIVNDTLTITE